MFAIAFSVCAQSSPYIGDWDEHYMSYSTLLKMSSIALSECLIKSLL